MTKVFFGICMAISSVLMAFEYTPEDIEAVLVPQGWHKVVNKRGSSNQWACEWVPEGQTLNNFKEIISIVSDNLDREINARKLIDFMLKNQVASKYGSGYSESSVLSDSSDDVLYECKVYEKNKAGG